MSLQIRVCIGAKDSISTAASYGIVNGYNENTFGPDDTITRGADGGHDNESCPIDSATARLTFVDSQNISSWAQQAMATVVQNRDYFWISDNSVPPPQGKATPKAVTVIVRAL